MVGLSTVLAPQAAAATAEDRAVIAKPQEPRPDVFFLAGRVRPDYRKKPVVLQRRNCPDCSWFAAERFRTDGDSRSRASVADSKEGEKKVCYRVKVPSSMRFRTSVSEVDCGGPLGGGALPS